MQEEIQFQKEIKHNFSKREIWEVGRGRRGEERQSHRPLRTSGWRRWRSPPMRLIRRHAYGGGAGSERTLGMGWTIHLSSDQPAILPTKEEVLRVGDKHARAAPSNAMGRVGTRASALLLGERSPVARHPTARDRTLPLQRVRWRLKQRARRGRSRRLEEGSSTWVWEKRSPPALADMTILSWKAS